MPQNFETCFKTLRQLPLEFESGISAINCIFANIEFQFTTFPLSSPQRSSALKQKKKQAGRNLKTKKQEQQKQQNGSEGKKREGGGGGEGVGGGGGTACPAYSSPLPSVRKMTIFTSRRGETEKVSAKEQ